MFDLKILDKILTILSDSENHTISVIELNSALHQDILISRYINEYILNQNIERLLQDNYIKEIAENLNLRGIEIGIVTKYRLTVQGYTFIKESGYYNTFISKISLEKENSHLRESQIELNNSTLATNELMTRLTKFIAVGTIIAAIYYLLEIYSFFFPCKS